MLQVFRLVNSAIGERLDLLIQSSGGPARTPGPVVFKALPSSPGQREVRGMVLITDHGWARSPTS